MTYNYEKLKQSDDETDEKISYEPESESSSANRQIRQNFRSVFSHHFFTLLAFLTFIFFILYGTNQIFSYKKILRTYFDFDAEKNENLTHNEEWSFTMNDFGTESCIRLFDINEDGLDDLIFGLAGVDEINTVGRGNDSNFLYSGLLMGVRGFDGEILWKTETKSQIFELNCHTIDINRDGKNDCIGTGRRRTFIGFDPRSGKIFWDNSFELNVNDNWNLYNPIILPYDVDNDSVNDIVVSTGGNPTIPSDVREREAGRILMYSGGTGRQIGARFLEIPENKETYMSPVLHVQKDGSAYLFIGSGGETVSGHLFIISLRDYHAFITGNKTHFEFKGDYKSDKILREKFRAIDKNIPELYSLFESRIKGVMVPPVLADVNKDGTRDILIMSFDGAVVMLDGETFEIIWQKYYQCHETYTSPSPGYFDDDDILDFMFVQNLGTFDFYKNSSIIILSGSDGGLLWQMNTPRMQMISALTIQTENHATKRDLFYFRAQGVESMQNRQANEIQQVYHGIEPQQPVDKSFNLKQHLKREIDEFKMCQRLVQPDEHNLNEEFEYQDELDIQREKDLCENDEYNERHLSTYGFIMDRTIQHKPAVVFKSKPQKIYYDYTQKDLAYIKQKVENLTNCIVLEPMERNTGAIGHLSSKDELDIVTVITRGGMVRTPWGEYLKILTNMKTFKKSLRKALEEENYALDETIFKNSIVKTVQIEQSKDSTPINELKFKKAQSWTAYMGYKSDSWYD